MYQLIYDFINNNIIGSITIADTYAPQLAIILTHISIIIIYAVLIALIFGVFRWFKNACRW